MTIALLKCLLGLTASVHSTVLCLLEGVTSGRNGEEGWAGVMEYVRPSHQISSIHRTPLSPTLAVLPPLLTEITGTEEPLT